MTDLGNRRPLKSRGSGWAKALAASMARAGVKPDHISFAAVVFALLGFLFFYFASDLYGVNRGVHLALGALCIQLRLVCNLLDGMVAVEHGRGSPYGPIWNELPDRIADVLFIVGAGYVADRAFAFAIPLSWLAASLAILTAYIRELGRGLGLPADFSGPMAKPQRMAVLTLAAVVSAFEVLWQWGGETFSIALAVIVLGAVVTAIRRTLHMAKALKERAAEAEALNPPPLGEGDRDA